MTCDSRSYSGREDTAVLLKESEDTFEALKKVDTVTQIR